MVIEICVGFRYRFGDFFNTSLEMWDHQHRRMERHSQHLAELRQCCGGVREQVEAMAAARREEDALVTGGGSGGEVPSSRLAREVAAACAGAAWNERAREQMRFDANRILSAIGDQVCTITIVMYEL